MFVSNRYEYVLFYVIGNCCNVVAVKQEFHKKFLPMILAELLCTIFRNKKKIKEIY